MLIDAAARNPSWRGAGLRRRAVGLCRVPSRRSRVGRRVGALPWPADCFAAGQLDRHRRRHPGGSGGGRPGGAVEPGVYRARIAPHPGRCRPGDGAAWGGGGVRPCCRSPRSWALPRPSRWVPGARRFLDGDGALPPLPDPDSLSTLQYTGGTTGRSKGRRSQPPGDRRQCQPARGPAADRAGGGAGAGHHAALPRLRDRNVPVLWRCIAAAPW